MSDILKPINDRRQAPYLSESDAMAVEWLRLSWADAIREREERITAELTGLRRDNAALAERNDELSVALGSMTSARLRDHERLATAERVLTIIMLILVLATLFAIKMAWTTWR